MKKIITVIEDSKIEESEPLKEKDKWFFLRGSLVIIAWTLIAKFGLNLITSFSNIVLSLMSKKIAESFSSIFCFVLTLFVCCLVAKLALLIFPKPLKTNSLKNITNEKL